MEEFVGLTAIVMVFGIPLSAIIGSYYVKIQKIKHSSGLNAQGEKQLQQLREENAELRYRLENLEEIVLALGTGSNRP